MFAFCSSYGVLDRVSGIVQLYILEQRFLGMANLKRNNHDLPQCYQKGFTNSADQVWVKFADKPTPELRNPASVGRRRSLYIREHNGVENDEVEDFFSQNVETLFAALSQRIKDEREKFSEISGTELGILGRFVASQTVRTLAHKQCIEEQAGGPVDRNTFLRVMGRKMWTMMDVWLKNRPKFYFYTPLPYVGEHFITGDNPVLVIQMNENQIWVPADTPNIVITDLGRILQNPNHGFWISLSPYVCVSIRGQWDEKLRLPPETMEPRNVRLFNSLVRGQSKDFILARDKESLN